MPRASKQQARYAVGRCLMLWSSNDVTQQGSRPKTKLCITEAMSTDPVKAAIPLWYAQRAWAQELIMRSFGLQRAEDVLLREFRGVRAVPGTVWFIRAHGIGVDVFKTPDVGGIDFDFDKPDPDPWRMTIFIERQVNDGNLPYELYRELLDDEDRMKQAIEAALGSNA